MKKIIITIITIAAMINLVSCKSGSETTVTSYTIGDNYATITTQDDDDSWEDTEVYETEGRMSDAEYHWLLEQYQAGNIELDVLEEYLFTGTVTKY